jgi:UDP-N-acetylglucosamine 2-epimerase (non-hydrolysing)
MKKKVLFVFGTRPEAIKMASVIKRFQWETRTLETKVCVTGQHRQMLDQVLNFFEIVPDYDLNLMKEDQDLHFISAAILLNFKKVLDDFVPDYVFVHGDTTTSTFSALASFYAKIKVAHIEAGLRTFNKYSPFPEELNRQITSRIAATHFAPTLQAKKNLLSEGVEEKDIIVTGNTVVDSLLLGLNKLEHYEDKELLELKQKINCSKNIILVTGHRRENFGKPFLSICEALKRISEIPGVLIVYPVHLNPNVQGPVKQLLSSTPNVLLIEPVSYPSFIWLMSVCSLILTDSGGVQEEAPTLGKQVLVMRDTTERPEAIEAGTARLVGTNSSVIYNSVLEILAGEYHCTIKGNPYGDGRAADRILHFIEGLK